MKTRNIGTTNRRLVPNFGNDFYATPEWATKALLENETFHDHILEPCCGDGSMSSPLQESGYTVISSDKYDRGFGSVKDAFQYKDPIPNIITNPPFNIAERLFHHLYPLVERKLCFLLRTAFLEGSRRYNTIFKLTPPTKVYVFSERLTMYPGSLKNNVGNGAMSFSWFVFDKESNHKIPEIKWITPGTRPKNRNTHNENKLFE